MPASAGNALRGPGIGRSILLLTAFVLSGCGIIHKSPVPSPITPLVQFGDTIREIRFVGMAKTDEEIVTMTLGSEVGQVYDEALAAKDYVRMLQLGVFTTIEFATVPVSDGIVLEITVQENSNFLPLLSVKYTEENGFEVGPAVVSPNLFGWAAKAGASARWGGATNYGVRYSDPWRIDPRWWACCYDLNYNHNERYNELDNFDERSDEFYLQYLYYATERFHFGPRVNLLGLSAEPDSTGTTPPVILDPDGRDKIPSLGLVVEYDSRNLINYPTRGFYLQASGMQNGGFLGGSSDYFRGEADFRGYTELSGPKHSLAFYSYAVLTTGEVGVDIPIHQDFHIGGTNSVRGWQLGSREGKSQWLTTAEYWWNLVPRSAFRVWFIKWSMGLQLAAFGDVGTAWNTTDEFNANWIGGGGLGARLTIPQIGIVRLDVGIGEFQPDFYLGFHLGGGEKAYAQKKRVR